MLIEKPLIEKPQRFKVFRNQVFSKNLVSDLKIYASVSKTSEV